MPTPPRSRDVPSLQPIANPMQIKRIVRSVAIGGWPLSVCMSDHSASIGRLPCRATKSSAAQAKLHVPLVDPVSQSRTRARSRRLSPYRCARPGFVTASSSALRFSYQPGAGAPRMRSYATQPVAQQSGAPPYRASRIANPEERLPARGAHIGRCPTYMTTAVGVSAGGAAVELDFIGVSVRRDPTGADRGRDYGKRGHRNQNQDRGRKQLSCLVSPARARAPPPRGRGHDAHWEQGPDTGTCPGALRGCRWRSCGRSVFISSLLTRPAQSFSVVVALDAFTPLFSATLILIFL
jgi:hypothetical protein